MIELNASDESVCFDETIEWNVPFLSDVLLIKEYTILYILNMYICLNDTKATFFKKNYLAMFKKNVVKVYFLETLRSFKITILENRQINACALLSATCHLSLQSRLHEIYGAYSYKSSDRSSDENGRVRSYFRPLYSIPSWYSYPGGSLPGFS